MKKILIYLGIVVGLFAVLFFVNQASLRSQDDNVYGIPASKLNPLTVKQLKNEHYQNIILPDAFKTRMASTEGTFVYFFSPSCTHCVATTPHLVPLAKELNVDLPLYNVMEFPDAWNEYQLSATPTLAYYKEGKLVDSIVGGMTIDSSNKPTEATYNSFKDFLNKYKPQ